VVSISLSMAFAWRCGSRTAFVTRGEAPEELADIRPTDSQPAAARPISCIAPLRGAIALLGYKKKESGSASQTVSNYQRSLTRLFQEAIDKKDCNFNGPNLAALVKRFDGEGEARRNWLAAEEALFRETMWKYWPNAAKYRLAQFDLALHTGMRRENMYGLHGNKRKVDPTDPPVHHKAAVGQAQPASDAVVFAIDVAEAEFAKDRVLRPRTRSARFPAQLDRVSFVNEPAKFC
jgi:hypothetical protein